MGGTIGYTHILILVVICTMIVGSRGQDIGFPDIREDDKALHNAENKKPLFLPLICNENELFYPGDHKNDYVCDCKPAHIYYPKTDRCYGAYRQGPCAQNEYLVMLSNSNIPQCIPNVCKLDGVVSFNYRGNSSCQKLDEPGPCLFPELSYVVGVNSTTLELECLRQPQPEVFNRFSEDELGMTQPQPEPDMISNYSEDELGKTRCLKGSKLSVLGKCVLAQN